MIAVHEVIPATVVSVLKADNLTALALDSDTIDLPIIFVQLNIGNVDLALFGHPPRDLVVTLHRLII